jgi:hypothetical protein
MLRSVSVELPELVVPDASAWREWLGEHHDKSHGVWLVLAGQPNIAAQLSLEEGWFGRQRKLIRRPSSVIARFALRKLRPVTEDVVAL